VSKDGVCSDGDDKKGYTMAGEPMLYVFDGLAVVLEKEMIAGKVEVKNTELMKKADGKRYTCVVYEAGMSSYYSDECEIMEENKYKSCVLVCVRVYDVHTCVHTYAELLFSSGFISYIYWDTDR
jgi:hypothetical protein